MQYLYIFIARYITKEFVGLWLLVAATFMCLSMGLIIGVIKISEWLKNKTIEMLISLFLVIGITIYLYMTKSSMGTYFMMTFVATIVVLMTIKILDLVPFEKIDYAILYTVIFAYKNLDIFMTANISYTLILLFVVIFSMTKLRNKTLRGNIFNTWITVVFSVCTYLIFTLVYDSFIYKFYDFLNYAFDIGISIKVTYFIGVCLLSVLANWFIIYHLKKAFTATFKRLQDLGKNYEHTEKAFMVISIGMMLAIYILEWTLAPFGGRGDTSKAFLNDWNAMRSILAHCCVALVIILETFILNTLLHLSEARKKLENEKMNKQNLILYNADLEKNIGDIKNINHDIKNIFFTMNNFIERSHDEEMRAFFSEKIMPVATDKIKKNDVYMTLQQIPNEQFRAFLYYKILQGLDYNINMKLEVNLTQNYTLGMELIDLIRVLGILIDNAIEECATFSRGVVGIKITQDEKMITYIIKNTIRESQKIQGLIPGTSTKGLGRGRGLMIVNEIIEDYNNVVINTYLKENYFYQNLTLYHIL